MSTERGLVYEDAAECRTVEGWVCKTCRRWWGEDEHMARWCCAANLPCKCGGRVEGRTLVEQKVVPKSECYNCGDGPPSSRMRLVLCARCSQLYAFVKDRMVARSQIHD